MSIGEKFKAKKDLGGVSKGLLKMVLIQIRRRGRRKWDEEGRLNLQGLPWWSRLPLQGAPVQSLVRKLDPTCCD